MNRKLNSDYTGGFQITRHFAVKKVLGCNDKQTTNKLNLYINTNHSLLAVIQTARGIIRR